MNRCKRCGQALAGFDAVLANVMTWETCSRCIVAEQMPDLNDAFTKHGIPDPVQRPKVDENGRY